MTKQEIIAFMKGFPNFHLATVDGEGQPRTRGMFLYTADDDGFVFHTGSFKKLYTDLKGNPRVEACFFDPKGMTQIRAAGNAVEIDDPAYRETVVNSPGREFLKPMIAAKGIESIRIFRVKDLRVTEWGFASNFVYPKPETVIG
jgi:uncharacterized pyridoxamine 5'-phosphate oxidase family protein